MSDIFVSYASGDRERVAVVASALESAGYSVWWDRRIPIGSDYEEYIELKLNEARCVIVAWSARSIKSRWVKVEAGEAMKRGVLIPVMIDEVNPPLSFRSMQAAQLADWSDDPVHPEWVRLLKDLGRFFVDGDRHDPIGSGGEDRVAGGNEGSEVDLDAGTDADQKHEDKPTAAVEHLPLTGGASFLVGHAKDSMRPDHSYLGLNHWLVVVLERHRGMAERFAGDADLKTVLGDASRSIHDGNLGEALTVDDLIGLADEAARHRGNDRIWERDIALVLMEAAGLT